MSADLNRTSHPRLETFSGGPVSRSPVLVLTFLGRRLPIRHSGPCWPEIWHQVSRTRAQLPPDGTVSNASRLAALVMPRAHQHLGGGPRHQTLSKGRFRPQFPRPTSALKSSRVAVSHVPGPVSPETSRSRSVKESSTATRPPAGRRFFFLFTADAASARPARRSVEALQPQLRAHPECS